MKAQGLLDNSPKSWKTKELSKTIKEIPVLKSI